MPSFTAAVFVTAPRTLDNEHRLVLHALLYEGSRPYWEVHLEDKLFRFIPHPQHILEDGLGQMVMYVSIPKHEWEGDVHNAPAEVLEEELGTATCKRLRDTLAQDMIATGCHYQVLLWPGGAESMANLPQQIAAFTKAGVPVTQAAVAVR
jgi:hypothetical protein